MVSFLVVLLAGPLQQEWTERHGTPGTGKAAEPPSHAVNEIGLERGACLGACPVYTVVFRDDGSVKYVGERGVSREGKHTGTIYRYLFDEMARFVVEAEIMKLESEYAAPETCQGSAYVAIVEGKERKIIRRYGHAGPARLLALEVLIDRALERVDWD